MKINKLLILSAAFLLGLSACKGNKPSGDGDGSQGDPSAADTETQPGETETQPEESENQPDESETQPEEDYLRPYYAEGTSNGFPTQIVDEFKEAYDLETDVLPFENTLTWNYEAFIGSDGYAILWIYTDDGGTIGDNALEDEYLALVQENGVTVDNSQYDYIGYTVYNDDDTLLYYFYTYDGSFSLFVMGPEVVYDEFPAFLLNEFLETFGFEEEIPEPVSQNPWFINLGYDPDDYYFGASTNDDGEPGVDAIEDTFKADLEEAGWVVDDTYYDEDGYYANKANVEILFYSYEGEFVIYVYEAAQA